ncbi:MAG: DUF2878 domain-containing protein [Phycisphaerales bacterium]
MSTAKLINLAAFNIGWFACILGAANGLPWLGIAYVALAAAGHLAYHRWSARIAALYAMSFAMGVVADGTLVAIGILSFPEHASLLAPLALWMPCMWINFATALPLSLSFLRGRYLLAVAFGAVGAPGTYYAGAALGAVELAEPLSTSMIAVGIEWAVAMPLLLVLLERLAPVETNHAEVP